VSRIGGACDQLNKPLRPIIIIFFIVHAARERCYHYAMLEDGLVELDDRIVWFKNGDTFTTRWPVIEFQ
jgi:hypothetical protein